MGKQSILQNERSCYLCGKVIGLEKHHIFAGVANRTISENYGMWIYLCQSCHTGRNGAQYNKEKNLKLKRDAQKAFQDIYGKKLWMQLIRKDYLGWESEERKG